MHGTKKTKFFHVYFRAINEDALDGCNMLRRADACVILIQNLFVVQHKTSIKNSRTGKIVAARLCYPSSGNSYNYSLRNNSEDCSSKLLRDGSLRARI